MAKDNAELAKSLAAQGARMVPLAFDNMLRNWWFANGKEVKRMFGGSMAKSQQLYATLVTVVNKNPELLECEFGTLMSCLMQSAALDLFPGPYQECAYVPLWNGKTKRKEANFWPQYQGVAKKIYQSGFVRKITCRVVWQGDHFIYVRGSEERIEHEPVSEEARGEREGVYCIVQNRFGAEEITYLPASQVERTKKRAAGGGSSSSPWNSANPDDVDWMWKKTALKQAAKMLPKTPELARAIELDNAMEAPELQKPDLGLVPNVQAPPMEGEATKPAEDAPPAKAEETKQIAMDPVREEIEFMKGAQSSRFESAVVSRK